MIRALSVCSVAWYVLEVVFKRQQKEVTIWFQSRGIRSVCSTLGILGLLSSAGPTQYSSFVPSVFSAARQVPSYLTIPVPELVRKVSDISVPFTNWIRVASREKFGNWPQIMNSKFIASSEAATHCGHFKYVVLIYSCNNIAMIILAVATKLCWFQYTLW